VTQYFTTEITKERNCWKRRYYERLSSIELISESLCDINGVGRFVVLQRLACDLDLQWCTPFGDTITIDYYIYEKILRPLSGCTVLGSPNGWRSSRVSILKLIWILHRQMFCLCSKRPKKSSQSSSIRDFLTSPRLLELENKAKYSSRVPKCLQNERGIFY
jgi:hypothetical protein